MKVLAFVLNTLKPHECQAYFRYVDGLKASSNVRPGMPEPYDTGRKISVMIGDYPAPYLFEEIVSAVWLFDDNDKLSDIQIERSTIGF